MARPSDREYALKRQVQELKDKCNTYEIEIKRLKKELEKLKEPQQEKKVKKVEIKKECPDCGAEVKSTELPHGTLDLCSKGCGYRNVRSKK